MGEQVSSLMIFITLLRRGTPLGATKWNSSWESSSYKRTHTYIYRHGQGSQNGDQNCLSLHLLLIQICSYPISQANTTVLRAVLLHVELDPAAGGHLWGPDGGNGWGHIQAGGNCGGGRGPRRGHGAVILLVQEIHWAQSHHGQLQYNTPMLFCQVILCKKICILVHSY